MFAILLALFLTAHAGVHATPNETIGWTYDDFGAPRTISRANALAVIKTALTGWQACGVGFEAGNGTDRRRVVFSWQTMNDQHGRTTLLAPDEHGNRIILVNFDTLSVRTAMELRKVVMHEIGHVLGLPHSVFHRSIMSQEAGNKITTPTPDDIEWCRSMNAKPY